MSSFFRLPKFLSVLLLVCGLGAIAQGAGGEKDKDAAPWWNPEWTIRKSVTLETGAAGAVISEPVVESAVLLRLHDGNFQFIAGKEDGSDIRFVAADGKTLLPYHIERFDGLLNEAFVWVKIPEVKPGEKAAFWLYHGNQGETAPSVNDPKGTYDANTALVYHFSEKGAPAKDFTANNNVAENAGAPVEGSLIGGGVRFTGTNVITLPAAPSLQWSEGQALTLSVWIKPTALAANAVLFSRREGASGFVIGLDNGVPYVEITDASGTQRSAAGAPLEVNAWKNLAVVAVGGTTKLIVGGVDYATLAAGVPALNTPALLGRDGTPGAEPEAGATPGFAGEMDELEIAKVARPASFIQLAAALQGGGDKAGKMLAIGADEAAAAGAGHSEMLEHVMLFGDIAKNMMFDGWIAVGVCVLMIAFGWTVAVQKFLYLNSIQKGSDAFLEKWHHVSSDLTVLDHDDEESVRTFGGQAGGKILKHIKRSPLYHLYQIGSEEIRHRVGGGRDRSRGLSARSIQAIKASLESGLVRENQRMNKGLIFLTISIAGGPYVGLLGTVVGVMITFAIIAKSGEVDVNSIAPGIASALLATVAGLIVAIPALFIYSYLSSRIKDLLAAMQTFIDEFIAKMAEFYPTPGDIQAPPSSSELARQAEPASTTTSNHAS